MRAKQQAIRYYGIPEGQFYKYFLMAERRQGVTGENLLRICESRLDNIVYLLGWANSIAEARQLVVHGHFLVNGKKADIPSMLLRAGDVVSVKDTSKKSEKFKSLIDNLDNRKAPAWLVVDKENVTAKVETLPKREDIDFPIEEHLIVELYSK